MTNDNVPTEHSITPQQLARKLRSRRRRLRNRLTLGFSLVLIALYSIDLGFDRRSENFARTSSHLRAQEDLLRAAEGIEVVFFNREGEKHLSLEAPNAEFGAAHAMDIPETLALEINGDNHEHDNAFQHDEPTSGLNHLLLTPIIIRSFDKDLTTATLNANVAFMNAIEQEIHLAGDVVAHNTKQDSLLRTNSLSMHTESRQIFGNQPVELIFSNARTQAIGIQGHQLDGRWRLLSKVKTTLEIK